MSETALACRVTFVAAVMWLTSAPNRCLADDHVPVVWDAQYMASLRSSEEVQRTGDVGEALQRLSRLIPAAKQAGPFAVTAKEALPPSGDRHDYLSYSRYWWPNPETEDGLPYIRRDGHVNRPLVNQGDREPLGSLVDTVRVLCLSYYFLEDAAAGKRAVELMRTWFLNPATRMNPHLNFGQGVPGRADGRGAGIIDTRGFMWLLDSVALLDDSVGWSDSDVEGLQTWFCDYGDWLRTSPLGRDERDAKNNHGSWYDAQVARYALFAGQHQIARETVEAAKQRRLEVQFQADGIQPEALRRTLSLHYSMFNLTALVVLARVGDDPRVDVDLWSYAPSHGCDLERAHEAMIPFVTGKEDWRHQQIKPYRLSHTSHLALRLASQEYQSDFYARVKGAARIKAEELDLTALLAASFTP